MANHPGKSKTLTGKILSRVLRCCVYFLCFTTLLTVGLRFFAPLTTGVMIERRLESFFSTQHYSRHYHWQSSSAISPDMKRAVIAAEDQLFAEHSGFDWRAIDKAMTYNEQHSKNRKPRIRGASTISQQTAKNLFLWSGRSWLRKALEAYFTVLIECVWSKERILEMYLNIIEFGDGIYGVEAASQHFFGKSAARLTASEAALLTAVLPNPRVYQVEKPSAYIRGRQAWILRNMKQTSLKPLGRD